MIFGKNWKPRINEWIEWSWIPIEVVQPGWGEHIPRGRFDHSRNVIIINGKQSDKEIIKSIVHEVCHWVNGDRVGDPDIVERENRCNRVEGQWKVEPSQVNWRG